MSDVGDLPNSHTLSCMGGDSALDMCSRNFCVQPLRYGFCAHYARALYLQYAFFHRDGPAFNIIEKVKNNIVFGRSVCGSLVLQTNGRNDLKYHPPGLPVGSG